MSQTKVRLLCSLGILGFTIVVGIIGLRSLEGFSVLDALYFILISLSTVGYGDFTPHTTEGKLLIMFIIVAGVGTFMSVIASSAELLLNRRDKEKHLKKLNILVGVFFSEVGNELLKRLAVMDHSKERFLEKIGFQEMNWSESELRRVKKMTGKHHFKMRPTTEQFLDIRQFLFDNNCLFIRFLENPILLEEDNFTELQWALLHLKEELTLRKDLSTISKEDKAHLAGDTNRAYTLLVYYWFDYMEFIHSRYPYLFKVAIQHIPLLEEISEQQTRKKAV